MFHRGVPNAIDNEPEWLQAWAETAAHVLYGPQSTIGCGYREQSRLRDDAHSVAGGPCHAGEGVEVGGTVNKDEVVLGLDES
jgi:hypothetical protein